MAKQVHDDAVWMNVDIDTLSDLDKARYLDYKAAYRVATEQRVAFEQEMQRHAPEGKRIVFGYRYGKLSMAVVDGKAETPKAKAGTQSLADFLKGQAASGNRA